MPTATSSKVSHLKVFCD